MKYFFIIARFFLAVLFISIGISVLYPHNAFKIFIFENSIREIFKLGWLVIPFVSRLLIGLLFIASFLLLFYWKKIKWVRFLAPLVIIIPFITHPVSQKRLNYTTEIIDENIHEKLKEVIKKDEKLIVAYLTSSCKYCIIAGKKLVTAKKTSNKMPPILLAAATMKGVEELQEILDYEFDYILLGQDLFLELSDYQFPKIHLVENQKIKRKYGFGTFNYGVLHYLSKGG